MATTTTRDDAHRMQTKAAFDEHFTYLRAAGRADTTIAAAAELLRRIDNDLPHGLCSAYPEEIAEWLAHPGWTVGTRALYRAHIVRFCRWAVHGPNPCLDRDPSAGLPRPRVPTRMPRPATDEQVQRACTQARQPWRLHCVLAAYGGLRCCEIARLDRADVTKDDMVVHGKGDKVRTVPTDPYVWAAVRDLPAGPVTYRPRGGPPTAGWVSNCTGEYLKYSLGLHVSLHRFRAWYATAALDACGDILVVKDLLGHESVATTQMYTLVNADRRRAAVAGLPRLI